MAVNSTYYLDAADLSTATAVYLDSLLSLIAPDGFYSDGTIYREQSSGVLLTEQNCNCDGELFLAYRSSGNPVNTGTLCTTETPDIEFYLSNSSCTIAPTGTTAYNTDNILDPFNGGNEFYAVYVSICDNTTYTYICQISGLGAVTVVEQCTFPI
jgi:hypothetical protein